ncbi:MAG: rRNA pseudouridine synthase [Chlorobi bacterium]|nr:rRNA pseudouridine synthase [Chlorobiota bacterium]
MARGNTDKKKKGLKSYRTRHRPGKSPGKQVENLRANHQDISIRLNRFIAMSGICSRREADNLILKGLVTVNGEKVNQLGIQVKTGDKICVEGRRIYPEKKIYILLNKPKDYITTVKDPQGRKTVLDLINIPGKERIFPAGRLDRATTGVLLLTNDGDLSARLTHPRYQQKKIYHVFLDKAVTRADMQQILEGINLDGETVKADEVSYVDENDKTQVGMEIHSGKYHIVRKIFETLGYKIKRLDRVYFAGLTKKNLTRGRWRYLTPKEVSMLYRKIPGNKGFPEKHKGHR